VRQEAQTPICRPSSYDHPTEGCVGKLGTRNRVLRSSARSKARPSRAGAKLTRYAGGKLWRSPEGVLPASGHTRPCWPDPDCAHVRRSVPQNLFHVQTCANGCETLGEVPSEFIREQSIGQSGFIAWRLSVFNRSSQKDASINPIRWPIVLMKLSEWPELYQEHSLSAPAAGRASTEAITLGAVYAEERIIGRRREPRALGLDYAF